MREKASNIGVRQWIPFLVIGSLAVFVAFHFSSIPSIAQQQAAPAAKPADEKAGKTEGAKETEEAKKTEKDAAAEAAKAEKEAEKAGSEEEKAAAKTEKADSEKGKAAEEAKEAASEEEEAEELDNESCMDCHNPDILKMSKEELAENVEVGDKPAPPKAKPVFVFGELNLSIDEKKYADGVHADTACIECHQGIEEVPHAQRLKSVNCAECHEEEVETIAAGAHGKGAGPKAPTCIGCHDVHYGKGKDAYVKQWKQTVCTACHKANGLDTVAAHKHLYEPTLHISSLDCMICHKGKEPGVHNLPAAKLVSLTCDSCHTKYTVLAKEKLKPTGFVAYVLKAEFINKGVLKEFGYVVGANRIPLLDLIIILAVIGPIALPIFHGGLRVLTRRKGPIELPEEKILLHPPIERIWHWFQALCIVMLIITGALMHWPEKFPGWFDWAVDWHNWFGWAAVIAFLVWLVYNLATRRITHYIPKKGEIPKGMVTQAKFYGYGIFKHEPHPYAPTEDNKFNPLQKIAYLQFQVLLFPILLISGLLYMYPETFKGFIDAIGGLTVLAVVHYILGGLFAAFLVAHLYLATTGETVGENFKAIVFGYGIKGEHGDQSENV